ncbi:MAG: glycosyltransferase family 1 protein [Bacteroidia bacterium]|nr:glycosyltransferase family 1 protein [Bacteroidia bacterium]
MKKHRVVYTCGGRSFFSVSPGRKIFSVVNCWRGMGHSVAHVCGGDIFDTSSAVKPPEYGAGSFHRQWYRRVRVLDPLIRTVSERRDIQHDAMMEKHLVHVSETFRPDLIWERSCRLHCAGLVTARRLGVPYVLEWKDNIASYWLSLYRQRARAMERWKNLEADFIVTESEVLRKNLMGEGVDGNKILVAQNAVDPTQFCRDTDAGLQIRAKLGIASDTVLVGYLGSYAWYHDAGRLVKAMALLRKQGVANVRCLMVGAGKEYDITRRLAEKRGLLGEEVIMTPGVPKDEVPGVLAALDIAVLPGSTDIICPIKIQEYMACELPSVVPDYACNREVLCDGDTGMLFCPKNEVALAEKIGILVGDRELRERIGRKAREVVARQFTWEKTWGAALETVLGLKCGGQN